MTEPGTGNVGDAGPRRMWLVAVLFGLVSSAVLGGLVVLALRLSDPDPVPGSTGPVTPTSTGGVEELPSVALIGDSITEQSTAVLIERLADRWDLLVDGRPGFTIAGQLPAARALAASTPSQVIINLGSNDVAAVSSSGEVGPELAEMAGLFPTARCVHLVTVNAGIVWAGRSYADEAVAINEEMEAIAARQPNVRLIDWSAAVAEAEEGGLPDGPLLEDDVHPTPLGRERLAELYDDALSGCPAA